MTVCVCVDSSCYVRLTVAPRVYVNTGIAFPTCISIDNTVCHFSPLRSDTPTILSDGHLVKMYANLVIQLLL